MATNKLKGQVNVKLLNLRKGKSTNAEVLDILHINTEVEVNLKDSDSKWYAVVVNGVPGYCMKQFITLKKTPKQETEK